MPRPKKPRTIWQKPTATYFKPRSIPLYKLSELILHFEELEALRLADCKGLDQKKAAKKMKISRPTFQRVLSSARKKVAKALTAGMAIKIKGGDYQMVPRFGRRGGGRRAAPTGGGRGRMGGQFAAGPGGVCVCTNPECKHQASHQAGVPCYQSKCPKCGSPMIRGR